MRGRGARGRRRAGRLSASAKGISCQHHLEGIARGDVLLRADHLRHERGIVHRHVDVSGSAAGVGRGERRRAPARGSSLLAAAYRGPMDAPAIVTVWRRLSKTTMVASRITRMVVVGRPARARSDGHRLPRRRRCSRRELRSSLLQAARVGKGRARHSDIRREAVADIARQQGKPVPAHGVRCFRKRPIAEDSIATPAFFGMHGLE